MARLLGLGQCPIFSFSTWIEFQGLGLQLRSPSKGVLLEAHNQLAPTKYLTAYKHFPS